MDNDKNFFRKKCKYIRASLDIDSCSQKLCRHILNWNIYKQSKHVMLFYPIGSEYSLLPLLKDGSKCFYFPSVEGNEMHCVLYNKEQGFKIGAFNIKEPVGEKLYDISFIDLIFVPALAVDKSGCRLGYGKGFYDRFLKSQHNCTTAVPISSQLIYDKIPEESHDIHVDCLISENGIITCSI